MNGTDLWPDWQYMFFGDAETKFLIEIVIRTLIVYAYSLALLRWIGGRGVGQMSVIEFLLVVALGSAVGDAMFYPDVPLIHALLVITLVVVINKVIDIGMFEHPSVRRFFAGQTETLVRDGSIDCDALAKTRINREELFEGLRLQSIGNLGRVKHGYLEPSGNFSFFRATGPVVGLSLLPVWPDAPPPTTPGSQQACTQCGSVAKDGARVCQGCGGQSWTDAVTEEDDRN